MQPLGEELDPKLGSGSFETLNVIKDAVAYQAERVSSMSIVAQLLGVQDLDVKRIGCIVCLSTAEVFENTSKLERASNLRPRA